MLPLRPLSKDRVLGCLLGGAIGDALGYPIEFERSAEAIVGRFGPAPPDDLCYAGPADVSDDTQMTLFSAEALLRARGVSGEALTGFALGAYQRWYATQALGHGPPRAHPREGLLLADVRLFARRAPGQTCLGALALSFTRAAVATVKDPPNDSKGCGAVMRSAPFGVAARSREEAFTSARDAAVLTHGHPSGFLSAAYLAALVHDLVRGGALEEALRAAEILLAREHGNEELAALLARARAAGRNGPSTVRSLADLGGGWVGEEALAIGVACALAARRREQVAEALWRSVAHGGDSDSTGSITGNLVGAMLGAAALPAPWREQVELGDLIGRVASDLYDLVDSGVSPDPIAYPTSTGVLRVPGDGFV
jgi:ADP-ribosyl-[dinitrogen reductase] hydrolase